MRKIAVFVATMVLAVVSIAAADIIHLKNGNRIEAEGVRVDGERVVFTVFGGQMSIALTAVDKIEKSSRPIAPNAGLRNAVTGTPFRGATASPAAGGNAEGGPTPAQNAQELVQFYIQQRQQLLKEVRLYDDQIQTLRSVIFAKSAIFEDTDTERQRIADMEARKKVAEEKLASLMNDARSAGLGPGDLRTIESANPNAVNAAAKVENKNDPRDANVTWIDINNAEDDGRSSEVVLTEAEEKGRSTSPEEDEKKKK